MEKLRKLIASVSLAALIAMVGFTAVAQAATFSDVSEDHWAYEAVEQLVADGIVDVADTFRCNESSQRADFAKMVAEAFGLGSSTDYDAEFSDVVAGSWYAGYINVLAQNGVMTGDTDAAGDLTGTVRPSAYVVRAEAAKMVALAAGFDLVTPTGDVFNDVAVDAWYAPYVETLYANSVVVGYGDGSYLPAQQVSRCEVAIMIFKAKNPVAVVVPGGTGDTTDTDGDGVLDVDDACPTVAASAEEDVDLDGCIDEEEPVVETSTGSLTVARGDELAGATVPQGATHLALLNVKFTGSDEDVTVSDLTFAREGVGAAADFSHLYLYNGDDRLTTGRTVSTTTNTVSFYNLDLDVPAGETVELTLVADMDSDAAAADVNYFVLESADAVTFNGASIEGDFPVTGEEFSVAGKDVGTIVIDKYGSLSNPTVGEDDAEIAKFQLSASGEDVWLNQVSLRVRGGASSSTLSNFALLNGSEEVATVAELNSSDLVVFVLAEPIQIEMGSSENFTVTGDVGSIDPLDTILVDLEEDSDLVAIGEVYGYGALVDSGLDVAGGGCGYDGNTTSATTTSCTTTAWLDASCTTVQGGQVTIAFNGPTASDVAINGKDVTLFKFSMTSQQNVEVKELALTMDGVTADANHDWDLMDADHTANFTDIKVVDEDTGVTVGSPVDASLVDPSQTFTYTDTFTIDAGETRNFVVKADIRNNVDLTNGTVTVTLGAFGTSTIEDVATGDDVTDIVPSTAIAGSAMTLKSASLAVSLSSAPWSTSVVKGSAGVETVGFAFTAGAASDVKVTGVTLTGYVDMNGDGTFATSETYYIDDIVSSVQLYDDEGNVLSDADTFDNSTVSFSGMEWVIGASQTEKLIPVVTLLTTGVPYSTPSDLFAIDIVHPTGDITAENEDGITVTSSSADNPNDCDASPDKVVTVKAAGTIYVAEAGTPVEDDAAIAGNDSATDPLLVAKYKIYANDEAFTVTKMQFVNGISLSNTAIDRVILKYPLSASAPTTLDGSADVPLLSGVASFEGLTIAVPKSESGDDSAIEVEVYVTTNELTNQVFTSGARIAMDFNADAGFSANGATTVTVTGSATDVDANEIALYKALPTFAYHSSANCSGSLAEGDSTNVYCFSVTATGGKVDLHQLTFSATPNTLETGSGASALGEVGGWTIRQYTSSGVQSTDVATGTWASNEAVMTFTEGSEVVAEGDTVYYVLKAPITYSTTTEYDATSSLGVYLMQDTAYETSVASALSTSNNIWSDYSAASHSVDTLDWTGSYQLESLPTTNLKNVE